MADKKYFCFCESGCKYETMSKEQILTAIVQAVETGSIKNIDEGFITTVKAMNGATLRFFVGTQAEYDALTADKKTDLYPIITNDTTKEDLESAIEELRTAIDEALSEISKMSNQSVLLQEDLRDGSFVVEEANNAKQLTTRNVENNITKGGLYVASFNLAEFTGDSNDWETFTSVISIFDLNHDQYGSSFAFYAKSPLYETTKVHIGYLQYIASTKKLSFEILDPEHHETIASGTALGIKIVAYY